MRRSARVTRRQAKSRPPFIVLRSGRRLLKTRARLRRRSSQRGKFNVAMASAALLVGHPILRRNVRGSPNCWTRRSYSCRSTRRPLRASDSS